MKEKYKYTIYWRVNDQRTSLTVDDTKAIYRNTKIVFYDLKKAFLDKETELKKAGEPIDSVTIQIFGGAAKKSIKYRIKRVVKTIKERREPKPVEKSNGIAYTRNMNRNIDLINNKLNEFYNITPEQAQNCLINGKF